MLLRNPQEKAQYLFSEMLAELEAKFFYSSTLHPRYYKLFQLPEKLPYVTHAIENLRNPKGYVDVRYELKHLNSELIIPFEEQLQIANSRAFLFLATADSALRNTTIGLTVNLSHPIIELTQFPIAKSIENPGFIHFLPKTMVELAYGLNTLGQRLIKSTSDLIPRPTAFQTPSSRGQNLIN